MKWWGYKTLLSIVFVCGMHAADDVDEFTDFGSFEEPSVAAVEAAPVVPVKGDIPVAMSLPLFGTIHLLPFHDDKTGAIGFRFPMPELNKQMRLGPLVITNGAFTLVNGKLLYGADASLLGVSVRVGIRDIVQGADLVEENKTEKNYTKVTLGIDFLGKTPTLELISGLRFVIASADLVLEKTKPIQLMIRSSITEKPVMFTFTIGKKNTDVTVKIPEMPLSDLIPEAKDTSLAQARIVELELTIKNFISKEKPPQPRAITFVGKIDVARDLGIESAEQITIIGIYGDPKKGTEFSGTIPHSISWGGVTLSNPRVMFSSKKKTFEISGDAEVQGYKAIVNMSRDKKGNVVADASLGEKAIKPLAALAVPGFSDIEIRNPHVNLQEKVGKDAKSQLTVQGDVTLFGNLMHAQVQNITTQSGAVTLVEVAGQPGVKLSQMISPFKGTFFDTLELQDLNLVIASDTYTDKAHQIVFRKGLNFYAHTTLSGALAPVGKCAGSEGADIILAGYIPEDPLNTILRAQIPKGIKANKDLTIGELTLEIAGNPDPMVSLLTSFLFVPPKSDQLSFIVRIGISPTDALVAGTFEGFWNNPLGIKALKIGNVALEAGINYAVFAETGLPDELGLAGSMDLGNHAISMAGKFNFAHPDQLVLAGSLNEIAMRDVLNMFKIPNATLPEIEVRDLAIYISPEDTKIGEIVYPQGLKLSGEFILPNFTGTGYLRIEPQGAEMRAYCTPFALGPLKVSRSNTEQTQERLVTQDVVHAVQAAAQQAADQAAIANQASREAAAQLKQKNSPETLKKARQAFQKANDAQTILKKAIAERERVLNATNGPIISLALTPSKQELLVSGRVVLADIFEEDTFLRMSKDGIVFNFSTVLGKAVYQDKPLLMSTISGKSSGSVVHPEFAVIIDFEQTTLQFLQDQVNQQIQKTQQQVTSDLNKAIGSVQSLNQTMANADQKIRDAEQKVRDAQVHVDTINTAIHESDAKIQRAQDEVDRLQHNIDGLNQQIEQAKNEFNQMSTIDKALYGWAKTGGKATELGLQIAGLQAAKSVAQTTLAGLKGIARGTLIASRTAAQGVLEGAKGFLNTLVQGAAKGTISAAREVGTGVLVGAQEGAVGVLKGGQSFAHALLTALDIQKMHYGGSLQELAAGKLGNVICTAQILGKKQQINFNLDIKDAAGSLAALAQTLVKTAIAELKP